MVEIKFNVMTKDIALKIAKLVVDEIPEVRKCVISEKAE